MTAGFASAVTLPTYNVTNIGILPGAPTINTLAIAGDAMSSSGTYFAGMGVYGANWNGPFPMGFSGNGSATVNTLTPYAGNTGSHQWYYTPAQVPLTVGNQPNGINNSGTAVGQYNGQPVYNTFGSTTPTSIPGVSGGMALRNQRQRVDCRR